MTCKTMATLAHVRAQLGPEMLSMRKGSTCNMWAFVIAAGLKLLPAEIHNISMGNAWLCQA